MKFARMFCWLLPVFFVACGRLRSDLENSMETEAVSVSAKAPSGRPMDKIVSDAVTRFQAISEEALQKGIAPEVRVSQPVWYQFGTPNPNHLLYYAVLDITGMPDMGRRSTPFTKIEEKLFSGEWRAFEQAVADCGASFSPPRNLDATIQYRRHQSIGDDFAMSFWVFEKR